MISDPNNIIILAKENLEKCYDIVNNNVPLYNSCIRLFDMWEREGRGEGDISIGSNFAGINMNLYLGKEDSYKDILLFVEAAEDFLTYQKIPFKLEKDSYYNTESPWERYSFKMEKSAIHLFFFFKESKACKLVGTGEFIELKKISCM
jgi:hypothetical protein